MASSDNNPPDPTLPVIMQKLGRCVLRLQQYEILMKRMVANHEISGYADELKEKLDSRKAQVNSKTLGQLIGELTGSYLKTPEEEPRSGQAASEPPRDPKRTYLQLHYRLKMDEEQYRQTREGLCQLVALRNELVHHFMERFNLWDAPGRRAANRSLDDAYRTIDSHFQMLLRWARSMDQARRKVIADIASGNAGGHRVAGTRPETDWPNTPIVRQLLAAERDCNEGGWTRLSRAREYIHERRPDLTPMRYGCKSWRQVLQESRLFVIEKRETGNPEVKQVWYRSTRRASAG